MVLRLFHVCCARCRPLGARPPWLSTRLFSVALVVVAFASSAPAAGPSWSPSLSLTRCVRGSRSSCRNVAADHPSGLLLYSPFPIAVLPRRRPSLPLSSVAVIFRMRSCAPLAVGSAPRVAATSHLPVSFFDFAFSSGMSPLTFAFPLADFRQLSPLSTAVVRRRRTPPSSAPAAIFS